MNTSQKAMLAAIAVAAVALGGAGAFVMMDDDSKTELKAVLADSNDEYLTAVTWYVGTEVSNYTLDQNVTTYSGSVPGITFTIRSVPPFSLIANGTPTTAGTYTITTDGRTGTIEITVEQTVVTHTVTFVSSGHGTVSPSSLTVPSGSQISTTNNVITINGQSVTATPDTGYRWSSWTNASGTVTADRTITANFEQTETTYSVEFRAGTGGSVSPTIITGIPSGSTINVFGNRISINGTIVTATANSGYTFSSWTNASGTITADRTITANFVQDVQYITVGAISPAHGTVTVSSGSSTDEASHGATASISIAAGSSVTWYTVMDSGYVFLGYETEMGSLVSEDNPFTDTVDYDTFLLIGESQGGITLDARTLFVDSSSVFYYDEGDVITITDTTSGIYKWSASTKTGIVPFTTTIIETNMTTGAVIGVKEVAFTTREAPDVTVSAIAPAHGTVTVSSGSSSDTASHGATASITVASGSTVVWSATTDTGYAFNGWTRSGTPGTITDNPYTEIAVEDITLTALETSNTITVGAIAPAHGTVTVSSGSSTDEASHGATAYITVASGSYVTWNTVMDPGYSFYTYETTSGVPVGDYTTPYSATITVDTTLIVRETVTTLLVTFQAGTGGSVNVSEIRDVPYGSAITVSGQTVTINGQTVTATPDSGYRFDSWSNASGTIIANRTITANFIAIPVSTDVFWSNDQFNGKVDILYKFADSSNKTHTTESVLYTPTVADGVTTWNQSEYTITVDVSYPSAKVTATLSGPTTITKTLNPGKWSTFIVSIDTDNGTVSVTPIKTFGSFTDYTVYEKQTKTVLDFSSTINTAAILTVEHSESETGDNSPRFEVVSTNVFLNTYGVVLYNPTINLFDYWPQFDALRVNFYSFALYGESITINGTTYEVVDGKITVRYVSDGHHHYLPDVMPNATVQTRTFELNNIYITFEGQHAYLTFVKEHFTLDLGAYTEGSETISMAGIWYFATMVYEPYKATEKHLSDWKILPELNKDQMLLIFIAILIVAGAAVAIHARKSGLGYIDVGIIALAALVAFILLG